MLLTLRVVHILSGVFWAGTVFFLVSFLLPTFAAVGPGGAPVMVELMQKRKLFQKLPIVAILAIASGLWLYYLKMQGSSWAQSMEARILGAGGAAAIIALLIGVIVSRPAMNKADALSAEAATATGPARDALMAQIGVQRKKGAMAARVVATLLGVTVISMAIARYWT